MDATASETSTTMARPTSVNMPRVDGGPPATDSLTADVDMVAQKQYAQGFIDALRVVHGANKFEFTVTSPTVLPQITPSVMTPANAGDMHQIMLSLLGTTPLTSSSAMTTLPSPSAINGNDMALDEFSLNLLAARALPGPPVIPAPKSPDVLSKMAQFQLPTFANLTSLPSTSRPDKLNLTPPLVKIERDDSDGSDSRSRSSSRSAFHRDEMSLDEQERRKLERKRARNRQAASKCRQKKMDRINELEILVSNEKQRGARLDVELEELQRTLLTLQQLVDSHSNHGCPQQSHIRS